MSKLKKVIPVIILAITILIIYNINSTLCTDDEINELETTSKQQLKETKLGIGGGGALFEPAIDPFNSNNMLVVPDMGSIYISHNKGDSWDRVNLYGTVISATYDPNRKNVIYAGGSGLYRSKDSGKTFDLIFPRKDDVITRLTHNENGLQYYFTKSGKYDKNKFVKNILVDPDNSDHIFVLCYSYRKGTVFESTDNGENFNQIFTYETSKYNTSVQFDFNELIYRKETKDIYVINNEQIVGYNLNTKTRKVEYTSPLGLIDVTTVYENDKTYFIIIEKTDKLSNSDTMVYYTNDFQTKKDITNELTTVQPTTFNKAPYGDITYKYNFEYISATSLNNIYITNKSKPISSSLKEYPYNIDGIIRYHNKEVKYLFGNPFKDHNTLTTRLWADGNTYSLGIAASRQNEDEFLFTTLCGMVYSPDSIHLYPKYSTVTEGKYPNAKYVTNGIDEQATYSVQEDPFHKGVLLLLNTDLGLIRSEDNGASWARANNGIPNNWSNTIYDAAFDKRRENYVYSVWSGRHNVPYNASNETDNRNGGFAISKDGGKTWDTTYSTGLPKNTTPAKMGIIYPKDTMEVTIYLATFNNGFFVSYDSGKTFTQINDGIEPVVYKNEPGYQYILASDIEVSEGHIFGITAKNYYSNKETQSGELFEYKNNKWEKIPLPKNTKTPRDIYYHDGILYVSGVPTPIYEYKDGVDFTNYGGGVYAYQNGTFTQIFDESVSTTSVQIDKKGTIYIADIDGNIYRKEKNKDYQKIYNSYFYISKNLQLTDDGNRLYLATSGGGLLRLENLNSLYENKKPEEDNKDDKNNNDKTNKNDNQTTNKNPQNNSNQTNKDTSTSNNSYDSNIKDDSSNIINDNNNGNNEDNKYNENNNTGNGIKKDETQDDEKKIIMKIYWIIIIILILFALYVYYRSRDK